MTAKDGDSWYTVHPCSAPTTLVVKVLMMMTLATARRVSEAHSLSGLPRDIAFHVEEQFSGNFSQAS